MSCINPLNFSQEENNLMNIFDDDNIFSYIKCLDTKDRYNFKIMLIKIMLKLYQKDLCIKLLSQGKIKMKIFDLVMDSITLSRDYFLWRYKFHHDNIINSIILVKKWKGVNKYKQSDILFSDFKIKKFVSLFTTISNSENEEVEKNMWNSIV
uniref:Uncharacterized protein n=1 Tax=viral metagenome TaxID=1070528 RepID=A0A6C0AF16_9ZZZZ